MSVQCARKDATTFLAKNLLLFFLNLLCGSASCPCFIRLSGSTFRRVVFSEKCLHYRRTETRWWMVSISIVTADALFFFRIPLSHWNLYLLHLFGNKHSRPESLTQCAEWSKSVLQHFLEIWPMVKKLRDL